MKISAKFWSFLHTPYIYSSIHCLRSSEEITAVIPAQEVLDAAVYGLRSDICCGDLREESTTQ
jgi:hypothetical protein